jgi:D-alanyl-D-alanine dipeptidase
MYRIAVFMVLLFCACNRQHEQQNNKLPEAKSEFVLKVELDTIKEISSVIHNDFVQTDSSEIEAQLIGAGLMDVRLLDSSIVADIKYSTDDNFLKTDVYGNFSKCYLQPDVAKKLVAAQKILKEKYPYYSLIVYDAVRPRSVQYKMWNAIDVPYYEKSKYVSNPDNASLHNFGAAVDLSIIDENGIALDMGTPYDYFGEMAYPREEERLFKEGKLAMKQLLNRKILRDVMLQSGFMPITTEWWHFNSCTRSEAFDLYKIVE